MIAEVDIDTLNAIDLLLRKVGRIPWTDQTLASDGYYNIVIGVCPPSEWGVNLILKVKP